MLKINLEKDILELAGNDMDHINELMVIGWKVANEFPDLKEEIKKRFEATLDAKECPKLQSEKDFTNEMREVLGATNEPEEPAPLDLEDIEYLLYKAEKAEEKGNFISVSWGGSYAGVAVAIMKGNFDPSKRFDASFGLCLHSTGYSAQKYRERYNNCIKYLEQLAGDEYDN